MNLTRCAYITCIIQYYSNSVVILFVFSILLYSAFVIKYSYTGHLSYILIILMVSHKINTWLDRKYLSKGISTLFSVCKAELMSNLCKPR